MPGKKRKSVAPSGKKSVKPPRKTSTATSKKKRTAGASRAKRAAPSRDPATSPPGDGRLSEAVATVDLRPLYRWYSREKRDLPFRATTDFYPVWVSEIMLQQTRVAAMLPRFREFMQRFPSVQALAAASEEEVLAAWRGLGYYRRARNLRAGAIQVVTEHGGRFPDNEQAARRIKGVGEYTAAAVLSIAFGVERAVFDGNVRRVLSRLLLPGEAVMDSVLKQAAAALLGRRGRSSPGDHNQALMELGATVCLPGIPSCVRCPLAGDCRGLAWAGGPAGRAMLAQVPPTRKDARAVELEMRVFFIHEPRTDLVWVVRDGASRFFKQLWFFPVAFRVLADTASGARKPNEFPDTPGLEPLRDRAARPEVVRKHFEAGGFDHGITIHTIRGRVEIFEVVDPGGVFWRRLNEAAPATCRWRKVPAAELHEVVVSSIAGKILPIVRPEQPGLF